MTRADELLAQIRADPADDTPRAVYADLLDERGDERGRLIHLQMERARLADWDPRVTELEIQERVLLAKHGATWRAELPELPGVTWGSFARGFVGKVAFDSSEAFAAHRDAVRAAAPVHGLVLRWPDEDKPKKLEAIPGIDELTLVGTVMRKQDLKWLAGSKLLASLRSLTLLDSDLGGGLPDLAKSPHLGGLVALRIPRHQLGNAGATKLAAATTMPALAELDLSVGDEEEGVSSYSRPRASLGHRGALALAAWPGLARITSLDLSHARLGRVGLTALLSSPYAKALARLVIRDVADAEWEMDDTLAAFETGPAGALDVLDLGENDLDPDAAAALMRSRALEALKILHLDRVRSKFFDRVAAAPWIHSLRVLTCGEVALEAIVKRSPRLLHRLRVVADGSAAQGVAKRLTAAVLPALTSLDLSASHITDPSLRVLGAAADAMPNLVAVRLAPEPGRTASFTAEGAADFARSPMGQRLQSFHAGIAELDRAPPPAPIEIGEIVDGYRGPGRYL